MYGLMYTSERVQFEFFSILERYGEFESAMHIVPIDDCPWEARLTFLAEMFRSHS